MRCRSGRTATCPRQCSLSCSARWLLSGSFLWWSGTPSERRPSRRRRRRARKRTGGQRVRPYSCGRFVTPTCWKRPPGFTQRLFAKAMEIGVDGRPTSVTFATTTAASEPWDLVGLNKQFQQALAAVLFHADPASQLRFAGPRSSSVVTYEATCGASEEQDKERVKWREWQGTKTSPTGRLGKKK